MGQRITLDKGFGPQYEEPARQIIGVVADIKDSALATNPEPIVYRPVAQLVEAVNAMNNWGGAMIWAVRTKPEPYSLRADIQRELRIASGGLPVAHVRSMDQVLRQSMARSRFNVVLLSIFAGLAVLLAAIGIYGVISFAVGARVHEIGVRMALGAGAGTVMLMVVRQAMGLAAAGAGAGVVVSFAATRVMSGLLFGVTATDPAVFAAVTLLSLSVALVASYLPARRATRVDPMLALRWE